MRKSITKLKGFSITRHWVRSRPGSVLILVIALLVLLALIGTAYLSSTQSERYTSGQNTINTQADLLIDGLVYNVEGKITNGLYGTGGSSGVFRAPSQENNMSAVTPPALPGSGYNTFTSPQYEDFLADRVPSISPGTASTTGNVVSWGSLSWPLFTDSATSPNYSFDSPFATSSQAATPMYSLFNKASITAIPTYQTINGQTYPALLYYIRPNTPFYYSFPNTYVKASDNKYGGYLIASTAAHQTPASPGIVQIDNINVLPPADTLSAANHDKYNYLYNAAASASGDGIADAGLFKVPTGPIDGITYYAAVRVIDNNSAVNVSTAWSAAVDPPISNPVEPLSDPVTNTANYGFFRSNIGLREMLNSPGEMDYLNYYRFNDGPLTASPSPVNNSSTPPLVSLGSTPLQDTVTAFGVTVTPRTDFQWFSIDGSTQLAGDQLETQLARRPLYPGYRVAGTRFNYLDKSQSSALASRFSLVNPNGALSAIEQLLPYETVYRSKTAGTFPSSPYSPSQIGTVPTTPKTAVAQGTWYGDLFDFHQFNNYPLDGVTTPERTILTASNPVSNGIPSRMGNANTGPAVYSQANTYNFGDWVTYTDPTLSTNATHTFVCLQPILTKTGKDIKGVSTVPPTISTHVLTNQYWALVPFSYQPSKVSINTGTFEQLWLGFCQVMTDSVIPGTPANSDVTKTATVPQWQPPLMSTHIPSYTTGNYGEEQIPQFRSVIRDNRSWPLSNASNYGQPGSPTNTTLTRTAAYSNTPGGRVQLTPMQMVQLRAAIAAINTVSIRNTKGGTTAFSGGITASVLAPAVGSGGGGGPQSTAPVHMTRSRRLILPDTQGNPAFEVEVFGNDIQPFINQMYGYVSDPTNANSFLALQLINPDTSADMTIGANWAFATIDRTAQSTLGGVGFANLTLTLVSKGQATFIIPKATVLNGVVVPGYATFYDGTPPSGFTLPTKNAYEVSGLSKTIGQELIILRPRKSDGTLSKLVPVTNGQSAFFDQYNEVNLYDLVPVDQIDMTNANNVPSATNNLYYRRAADPSTTGPKTGTSAWNFTWPGFYTPYNINNTVPAQSKTTPPGYTPNVVALYSTFPLHQPIVVSANPPTPGSSLKPAPGSSTSFTPAVSTANPDFTSLCYGPGDPTAAIGHAPTFSTVTLQLANTSLPGINPVVTGGTGKNRFPFGGFARNADLLQIPYIGAYRIINYNQQLNDTTANPTHAFYEMNSVTMDASLANDTTLQPSVAVTAYPVQVVSNSTADKVDGPFVEQIGHFCPIGDTGASTYVYPPPATPPAYGSLLDFATAPASADPDPSMFWHYHWTKKLFDYFTVQAPNDDYLPNAADPDAAYSYYDELKPKYPGGGLSVPVAPVQNNTSTTANVGEDLIGVEGLININTAPWPVLATLPFVPRNASSSSAIKTDNITYNGLSSVPTAGADGVDDNVNIAKAIADYRSVNGPFKSIFDLYNVPAFRVANDSLLASEPGSAQGDFSPGGINPTPPVSDGARFDFEERFLLLNRISNLITTRSDTFTCYIDLQGWRNVGTGTPTLAVERRRAFIFDRNAYAPGYKNPIYFPVATGN